MEGDGEGPGGEFICRIYKAGASHIQFGSQPELTPVVAVETKGQIRFQCSTLQRSTQVAQRRMDHRMMRRLEAAPAHSLDCQGAAYVYVTCLSSVRLRNKMR